MTDDKKHTGIDWDSFPCILENPSDFRKGSGDYGVTLAVQVKHVGFIQPLMEKAQRIFAVFMVPVADLEQAETFIKSQNRDDSLPSIPAPGNDRQHAALVTVEVLAEVMEVDVRTVQLDADKWPVIRPIRGQYDAVAYCAVLRKAWQDAAAAVTEDARTEKTLILRQQRIKLEALNKERLGQLMNAEKTRQAIEHIGAEDRQALLNMPKTLGPQCDMLPGREVEIKLMDWVRKHLKEESAWDRIVGLVRTAVSTLSVRQGGKGKKRKKKK